MKRVYSVGDECWIKLHDINELQRGTVVSYFHLPSQVPKFYIVELADPNHQQLEIRDATLMSSTPDGPLPYTGQFVSTQYLSL